MSPFFLSIPHTGTMVEPGKVLCIGRNYAAHAVEMKSELPERPVVFLKPTSALIDSGGSVLLPPESHDVHHEVELVAVIGRTGRHISEEAALDHVAAYAVGLDMTARDLQDEAKRKGLPWTISKGFDTFAPLGALASAVDIDVQHLEVRLEVNGQLRQKGHTQHMLFSVAYLISFCSRIFTLVPGDLLFTGTPEGVGRVQEGDVLEATITGLPPLRVDVRRAEG
jgi:acylpyruvate hydrolase